MIPHSNSRPPAGKTLTMNTRAEQMRDRWMSEGLSREELAASPFLQFEQWYTQAIDSGIPEPNAMTLATVDAGGQPSVRTVLLKLYDEQGFVFFTNYESDKAHQIAANPQVALLFPWVALGRQVRITGQAAKIPLHESAAYFATRPRGSQIGAWASPQSQVITTRSLLDIKFDEIKRRFASGKVPLPDFWGGYRVVPRAIEFWQARSERLHDRFLYTRNGDDWNVERRAP
jgi:pyridoxamine 5'-phosphate oxidase